MSRRKKDNDRLPDFVPLFKSTMSSAAWRATSHGARSLYIALKWRYNTKLQNSVYLSTRKAAKELGSHRDNIRRWFRELQHYGFIVMVSPGCLGVEGKGKAPHWRLTEEDHIGNLPTRDFLRWDGTIFTEQKKQIPGPPMWATLDHPSGPLLDHPSGP
jgi:hypothetical protein